MPAHPPAQHDEAVADEEGVFPPDLHDTHHLWLKAILLAVWVVVAFGGTFFARQLQAWGDGGQWGYWMAAQGSVLIFIAIVVVYCWAMARFERRDGGAATSGPAPMDGAADDTTF